MAEKTVFPGMPVTAPAQPFSQQQSSGTVYPGIPASASSSSNKNEGASRPIMGFLFSVSRTPFGEFWPLYVGSNTIGRGSKNAICLSEASVSESHATIVIRKMQRQGNANGIFVFIQDTGSMCGTLLNGDTLDFNPKECKSGDIITIGANYELYLLLVDPDELGLKVKPEFQATEKKSVPANLGTPEAWNQGQPRMGMNAGDQPKGTMPGIPGMGFGQDSPSPQSSSNPFDNRKATIYMPKK
jgi:pSer/pThr/pTyr-binding forkhead associated (FHA) protein